jgi:hypothetical protein
MHELHVNQRQRGDQSWSHLLTAIRAGPTDDNVADIAARLKSRVSNLAGGLVRERDDPLWRDAPRLVSTKTKQQAYNTSRLAGIVNGGAESTVLHAGLGLAQRNGVVARGVSNPNSVRRLVPKEADNCGGLEAEIKVAVGRGYC